MFSIGLTKVNFLKWNLHINHTKPAAYSENVIFNAWLFYSSRRSLAHCAHSETHHPHQNPDKTQVLVFGLKHHQHIHRFLIRHFTVPCPWWVQLKRSSRNNLNSQLKSPLFGFLFFPLVQRPPDQKVPLQTRQLWPLLSGSKMGHRGRAEALLGTVGMKDIHLQLCEILCLKCDTVQLKLLFFELHTNWI